MKKVYFFLVFLFVFLGGSLPLKAQWVDVSPQAFLPLRFNKIRFIHPDTVYVVGTNSRIFKTTNGGMSWDTLYSGNSKLYFTDLAMFSSKHVLIAGGYGPDQNNVRGCITLETPDGGASLGTWTITSNADMNNPVKDYTAMHYLSRDTGLLVSQKGLIDYAHGPGNWFDSSRQHADLLDVYFATPDTVYIVTDSSVLLKSTNGGSSWNYIPAGTSQHRVTCFFTSGSTGFTGGSGSLMKTTDGGNTWQTKLTLSDTIHDIFFPSPDTGFAAGGYGKIYRTSDSGNTWDVQAVDSFDTPTLYGIYFKGCVGYACGYNGKIYKTSNCGGPLSVAYSAQFESHLYPNPFADKAFLKTALPLQEATLVIYNSLGQLVRQTDNLSGTEIVLERLDLPAGLYYYRISNNRQTSCGKLAIE
jgi:photosystem II stability/assembly factor-like uncharacterized protein